MTLRMSIPREKDMTPEESRMCEQFWTRFPAYYPHFAPRSNVQMFNVQMFPTSPLH